MNFKFLLDIYILNLTMIGKNYIFKLLFTKKKCSKILLNNSQIKYIRLLLIMLNYLI